MNKQSTEIRFGIISSVSFALGCSSGFELYRVIFNEKGMLSWIITIVLTSLISCIVIPFIKSDECKMITEVATYFVIAILITEISLTVFSFL